MYEPPITVDFNHLIDDDVNDFVKMIVDEQENKIVATVQSTMGVNIDKRQLSLALAYDRDQYDHGYEEGYNSAKKEIVYCKDCTESEDPYKNTLKGCGYLRCKRYGILSHEDDGFFCKSGERKEKEDGENG